MKWRVIPLQMNDAYMNMAIDDGFIIRGVSIQNGLYIDLGTYDEILEMDLRFRDE